MTHTESRATIRRKLEAGIEFNRARMLALPAQTKLLRAGEITAYLSAADEWLRGAVTEFPKSPEVLRSRKRNARGQTDVKKAGPLVR